MLRSGDSPPRIGTRADWRTATLSAFAILVFYLSLTPWTTLWDRDEPRFAQAANEMAASHQYLYPTFNGRLRSQKPILIYWLMSLSIRVLGPTELAVRFWSPFGVALTSLFTYAIGRWLISPRAGLLGMALVAFNPLMMVEGTAATADAVLLAGIAGAMAAFTRAVQRGPTTGTLVAMSASMAIAQLTKGPVGLVVPLLSMAVALWLLRDALDSRMRLARHVAIAAAGSVLVFLIWAIPANLATGGRLAREGLARENVSRLLSPLEGHGGNFFVYLLFYLPVILVGFSPWTLSLLGALGALARRVSGAGCRVPGAVPGARVLGAVPGAAVLTGWIVAPLLIFTVAATKLPHYILPIWPALALAVAGHLEATGEGHPTGEGAQGRGLMRLGLWLVVPLVGAELAVLSALLVYPLTTGLRPPSAVTAVVLLVTALVAFSHHRAGRYRRSALSFLAGLIVLEALVGIWLLPAFERLKPVPPLAAAVGRLTASDVPVFTYAFGEPSLDFYLHRGPITVLASDDEVAQWAHTDGPGVLVTDRVALTAVNDRRGHLPLREIAAFRGINYSNGQRVEVVALLKLRIED